MRTIEWTNRFKRDYRRELKGRHGRAIDREKPSPPRRGGDRGAGERGRQASRPRWRRTPTPTPPHRGGATSANRIARHGVKASAEVARLLRRAGPMSVRWLAGELGRDYKSVHREVAMLTATGLIERRAADEVAVGWDRAVTELDLAA